MHADAERALLRRQAFFEGFQLLENTPCAGQHLFALGSELQAAAAAHEHGYAKMTLQQLDLAAYRALGQAQLMRGLGEAAGIGDFDQRLQGLQRRQVANFIHAFFECPDEFITLVVSAKTF
ncbi:hypothetical protein D9M71_757530 [compost metagenome]